MDKVGYAKLTNYEQIYRESNNPIPISCHIATTSDLSQEMTKQLFGNIKSLSFDLSANCACGKYVGNCYVGLLCPNCKTKVSSIFCRDLEYKGWIIIPKFLPRLLHPQIYMMLAKGLWLPSEFKSYQKRKKLTAMDWLLDPSLPIQNIWPELKNGFSYFYENFDAIMTYLFSLPKNKDKHDLKALIKKYHDRLWMDKIPVINEFLHLVTQFSDTGTKYQVDESSPLLYETFSSLCSIVNDSSMGKKLTSYGINRRMYGIQQEYVNYTIALIETKVIQKPGLLRKSVVSGRMHFTSRAVIVPTIHENAGDEITIPWEMFLVSYESIILNHLINRHGWKTIDAIKHIKQAVYQPGEPIVDMIIQNMFEEVRTQQKRKGFPCLINRNPSVKHGATQKVFIVEVTYDRVIGFPPTITAAPNADYDKSQGFFHEIWSIYSIPDVPIRMESKMKEKSSKSIGSRYESDIFYGTDRAA